MLPVSPSCTSTDRVACKDFLSFVQQGNFSAQQTPHRSTSAKISVDTDPPHPRENQNTRNKESYIDPLLAAEMDCVPNTFLARIFQVPVMSSFHQRRKKPHLYHVNGP